MENIKNFSYTKRMNALLDRISEFIKIARFQMNVYSQKESMLKIEFKKTSKLEDTKVRAAITTRIVNDQLVLKIKQVVLESNIREAKRVLQTILEKLNAN